MKKVLVIVLGCLIASSAIWANAKSLADAANFGQGEKAGSQDGDSDTNNKIDTDKVITTDDLGKRYGGGASSESAGVTDNSGNPVGFLNANKEAIVIKWIESRKFAQFGIHHKRIHCNEAQQQKEGGKTSHYVDPDKIKVGPTQWGATYSESDRERDEEKRREAAKREDAKRYYDSNPALFKAEVHCSFDATPNDARGNQAPIISGYMDIYYHSPSDIRLQGKVH